jgi:hypothetical protein
MLTTEYSTSFTWLLPQWWQSLPPQQLPRLHELQPHPQPHEPVLPLQSLPDEELPHLQSFRELPQLQSSRQLRELKAAAGSSRQTSIAVEQGVQELPPCGGLQLMPCMPGRLCMLCIDRDITSANAVMGQHIICPNICIISLILSPLNRFIQGLVTVAGF